MASQSGGDPGPPHLALSANGMCTRYVIINKVDGRLENHNIFLVTKSIETYGSVEKIWSNRSDGSLTVALKEKYAKRIIEQMKTLGDNTPVTVKLDTRLNTSRAVIACSQLIEFDEKEILTELEKQNVIKVQHISRSNGDKPRTNTGVVILTFSTSAPPDRVVIGWRVCRTEKFYPRPIQCFRCYEFKHISKACEKEERCRDCSKAAHKDEEECSKEYSCINCKEKHSSTNKKCRAYQTEKLIVKTKTDLNISYPAARRMVEAKTSKDSYASKTSDLDKIISNERSKWQQEMESKFKSISEKMELLAKKEEELKKWYAQIKEKEAELKAYVEKKESELNALETHCNFLTNEMQKKDDLITTLKLQIEKQDQKILHIKEKHGKKAKLEKKHEPSPERELDGTPKRKKHHKKTEQQRTPHDSESDTIEIMEEDK